MTGGLITRSVRLIRLPAGQRRRAMVRLVGRALRDETGGETLEYALVTGLIVMGAIGAISCVGTKLLSRWNSVNSAM
jgi:pilus assembly protein Flp/PilA